MINIKDGFVKIKEDSENCYYAKESDLQFVNGLAVVNVIYVRSKRFNIVNEVNGSCLVNDNFAVTKKGRIEYSRLFHSFRNYFTISDSNKYITRLGENDFLVKVEGQYSKESLDDVGKPYVVNVHVRMENYGIAREINFLEDDLILTNVPGLAVTNKSCGNYLYDVALGKRISETFGEIGSFIQKEKEGKLVWRASVTDRFLPKDESSNIPNKTYFVIDEKGNPISPAYWLSDNDMIGRAIDFCESGMVYSKWRNLNRRKK